MSTFYLPDLGEGLQEAEIVAWHVSEGDHVVADQPLVSVETDKAVVEVPSPLAGRIAQLFGTPGDIIEVGAPLVAFDVTQEADPGRIVGELETTDEVMDETLSGEVTAAADAEAPPFAVRLIELRTMAGRGMDAKTRGPVAGAVVWDGSSPLISAVSDSAGQFALRGPATHRLEILAGAVGYLRPEPFEFPLTGDGRTGPTIALDPAAAVSGRVVDANGQGIAGATVSMNEKQSGGMMRFRSGMPLNVLDPVTDSHVR